MRNRTACTRSAAYIGAGICAGPCNFVPPSDVCSVAQGGGNNVDACAISLQRSTRWRGSRLSDHRCRTAGLVVVDVVVLAHPRTFASQSDAKSGIMGARPSNAHQSRLWGASPPRARHAWPTARTVCQRSGAHEAAVAPATTAAGTVTIKCAITVFVTGTLSDLKPIFIQERRGRLASHDRHRRLSHRCRRLQVSLPGTRFTGVAIALTVLRAELNCDAFGWKP